MTMTKKLIVLARRRARRLRRRHERRHRDPGGGAHLDDAATGACTFPASGEFQLGAGLLDVGAGHG